MAKKLNTSLLREKFTLINREDPESEPYYALSNRMPLKLVSENSNITEEFVIRAHNMHLCVRMAVRMLQSFYANGPIANRDVGFDWNEVWEAITSDYEYKFNPDKWIAVYNKGKIIFEEGTKHHPFLDIIEQCDVLSHDDYEKAIPKAEEVFRKAGKNFKIDYDGNLALVADLAEAQARCGLVIRGPSNTHTFSFSIEPKEGSETTRVNLPRCLSTAAAFLEGIQMGFMVGMNNVKIELEMIEYGTDEMRKTEEARKRLVRLAQEIGNFENVFNVRFRPEKPQFPDIVMDAQKVAMEWFAPEDEEEAMEDSGQ